MRAVKIIEENRFPVENMASDPTAQAIVKTSEITTEEVQKIANTVASVKISGVKRSFP